jgi:tRNA(Ile)-lysidine synthetase-like protein
VKGDLRGIEFDHVESVIDMQSARVTLPGLDAVRSFDLVRLTRTGPKPAIEPLELMIPGTYAAPDGMSEIRLEPCDNLELTAPLVLRGWRPGDHYRPVGKSRDQKLRNMFRSAGVLSWRRPYWPILECDGKIAWARQFGVAAEFATLRVSEISR